MLSTIWYVLLTVIGFGMLVLVHEFGHFIAAKAIGVGVETFSLGLGPRLFGRKFGDTDYCFSAIPWGGFVKLAGDERKPGRIPEAHDFYGKPPGQRIIVFAAGTIMNGIIGVLAFILAFTAGVPTSPPVIGSVITGSPAWIAGLREDDRIVKIDGRSKNLDFGDIQVASLLSARGKIIHIEAERNGKRIPFSVIPEYSEESGIPVIGVSPKITLQIEAFVAYSNGERRVITDLEKSPLEDGERSPAIEAGILPGDVLIEANGIRLTSHSRLVEDVLSKSEGKPIDVIVRRIVERNERKIEETVETTIEPIATGQWLLGVVCQSTHIRAIRRDSWALKAGFIKGDIITHVNEIPVSAVSQIEDIIGNTPDDGSVVFIVNGESAREIKVSKSDISSPLNDEIAFEQKNIISRLTPGFPADKAGMRAGDVLIDVGGKEILKQPDITEPVQSSNGEPITVRWLRDGEEISATVAPQRMWELGVLFKPLEEEMNLGLWSATVVGTRKALRWVPRVLGTLEQLITGRIASRHLGGPIGIVTMTYQSAKAGYGTLLYFLGFISINLAIFNLLPIPVLDGGHIFFTLLEKLKGSPVSEKAQNMASYVGLGLLLLLMVYAAWNDLVRLIFGIQL